MSPHMIRPHPEFDKHWYVGKVLVAGGDTPEKAAAIYEQSRNPIDIDPVPTPNDVRMEAKHRMIVALGARDAHHLELLISNGSRETIGLLRKGQVSWTAEETARAQALEQKDAIIEAIRSASNLLETDPPLDYRDDKYWP